MIRNPALRIIILLSPLETLAIWFLADGMVAAGHAIGSLGAAAGPATTALGALVGIGLIVALVKWVIPSRAERAATVAELQSRRTHR